MTKTEKPNLENLRKRAKTLVRQHRDRYHPVAAKLRAAELRFAAMSDRAILDAPFTLADAQGLVARGVGYADWEHATRELAAPAPRRRATIAAEEPVRLRIAFPQLFVADVRCAAGFYEKTLGFSIAYLYGEPPFYGLVTRDGVGLNLRWVPSPPIPPVVREQESLLSANIVVDGVKALYLDAQRRGADFAQTLKEQPWGATDFVVRDLDGNRICFASPARAVPRDRGDVRREPRSRARVR
jgi:catechol 2,3-dioxygenase-like lactoylglutathione lyase family enzyme